MAASAKSGPSFNYGNLDQLSAAAFGLPVPDPNQDAGPGAVYQGLALLDPRILFPKDQVTGFTGKVQAMLMQPKMRSIGAIPSALASNNIAAAQNVTLNTPMTLAAASVGITLNVPIRPYSAVLNGNVPVTAAIALDFGFGFGNCTAGSATIQVSSTARYTPGMPLVIGGVGNVAGTTCLLTQVATVVDATHITVNAAAVPQATNATAPIGTGDVWGPSEIGFPLPQAAYPFQAQGPGLFLDTSQAITRGVRIVGASGGAGGNFLVSGWDIFDQPMTQLVTVAAGASTGWSLKTFKYLTSVVPQFTDAHNYSVGTSDVFGFAFRDSLYEEALVFWAGLMMTASTGFTVPDTTSPATNLTGDVRGTIQTSASGGGSGIGSTASNGTVSSLAMTGNRLEMGQFIGVSQALQATQANPTALFGVQQA